MIILIKLFIAHFAGDFLLQPTSWVKKKEKYKAKSFQLYLHILIHGFLVLLLLWDLNYWLLALLLMTYHGIIDIIKLYFQKEKYKVRWFFIDQILHIAGIFVLWILFFQPEIKLTSFLTENIWIYLMALIFISYVSGIVIQNLMLEWSKQLSDHNEQSLHHAGKYIGIIERILVFIFVVTENWESIGFLLAAKSIFRFGDLKEAKHRKLTEYILIGTLLSFGIALLTGMFVIRIIN